MWPRLTLLAVDAPDLPAATSTGDQAVKVAVIGGAVTVVVTLIGALVTLLRRDGNRTTPSPPDPTPDGGSPTLLALIEAVGDRVDDLVKRVERIEGQRRHPSGGGPQ